MRKISRILMTTTAVATATICAAPVFADDVKVGVVTFLSGGAAGPFGVPARNAAELVIDAINKGDLPAPYNTAGLAGNTIAPVYVDENSKQKNADFQKLVEKDGVEMVVGYISSSSCKSIAPEAEKLKRLTILFDCGTPQIFEDIVTEPHYTFRTAATATMDNVAAARYLMDTGADAGRVAGINQNYAWGQDSWRDFSASLEQLAEATEVVTEQFPKVYAGQYGSEISALLTNRPEVVHSSFWGGDMEAFVIQGSARGLFERSKVVLTAGETAMFSLAKQIPEGTVIGARGPHGDLAPESDLNTWFRAAYKERFGSEPTYPSYKMAQALLGVKAAADKAGSSLQDDVIGALEGLEWEGPSGKVSMALAGGHQAIQDTAYGTFKLAEDGSASLVDVIRYDAGCVNPPAGVKSLNWIKSGFDGATCN
ncbi:Leucine-specific-binding protein precursor [Pelagimonas phthalicica]|uniref:Leucine-specific-binding protein n=1 Tax=Pelagimonas phthalicica TaxID=1037362 RepID=A0A238JB84_9RHOB|nr:ABC transporter substrate-binding protein [Pelagimonas phthalicica]TDS94261.1 amino acid/amide ABC transporter substrate-binding protein (HAAT family) [Pelagimonas phthalicica]SMX27212.1 Leucine-specific-binding protein precursor [Pelagimonas phthalicica]